MLWDSRHLLPEELTQPRKGREKVSASPGVGLCRQAQLCGQLGIRRPDVFVAALAGKPAIKSTTNRAFLFYGRPGDERSAQVIRVRDFQRVRRVVITQRGKEVLVAEQFSQRFEHQRAFAAEAGRISTRIGCLMRGSGGIYVITVEAEE